MSVFEEAASMSGSFKWNRNAQQNLAKGITFSDKDTVGTIMQKLMDHYKKGGLTPNRAGCQEQAKQIYKQLHPDK
jgi:nitrate reductase assembly molybdenum cofactor insertion protein NarJ